MSIDTRLTIPEFLTPKAYLDVLVSRAKQYNVLADVVPVLENPNFLKFPGSTFHHHISDGGLIRHTSEVLDHALANIQTLHGQSILSDFEFHEACQLAVVAITWHDSGKLYEYRRPATIAENKDSLFPTWVKVNRPPHGHLSESFADARQHLRSLGGRSPKFIQDVGHAILSHHGRLEWGSPVTPHDTISLIIHQADMISTQADKSLLSKLRALPKDQRSTYVAWCFYHQIEPAPDVQTPTEPTIGTV